MYWASLLYIHALYVALQLLALMRTIKYQLCILLHIRQVLLSKKHPHAPNHIAIRLSTTRDGAVTPLIKEAATMGAKEVTLYVPDTQYGTVRHRY